MYEKTINTFTEEIPDPYLQAANTRFGITSLFPFQRLAITNILEAAEKESDSPSALQVRDTKPHQVIILPTGAGKSLCFMLPALFLPGATLVIFPLLGLISDQARRCREADIGAGILRGGQSRSEREAVWKGLADGSIKILLSNPETALSPAVLPRLKEAAVSHLVIDEMHTVSEWGDTFRPIYLQIGRLPEEACIPVVTAFTATASEHILTRIREIIFPHSSPHLIRANPDRPNIAYRVIPSICKDHDIVRLLSRDIAANTPATSGPVQRPAIVFCRSRIAAEMTARMLRHRLGEQEIYFYHAGLEREEKQWVENWFYSSTEGILCATCAYGMGVDKKDIRTVIHRSPPPSVEAYLQESGRGGRDRKPAEAILLFGPEDRDHLAHIGDSLSAGRYQAMIEYAEGGSSRGAPRRCRREMLLEMLQAEPETCFGCDVCNESVQEMPQGQMILMNFVRKNRRRYTLREARQILSGACTLEVVTKRLWRSPGFAALAGWSQDEVETALRCLAAEGWLKIPVRGPWKHRLTM